MRLTLGLPVLGRIATYRADTVVIIYWANGACATRPFPFPYDNLAFYFYLRCLKLKMPTCNTRSLPRWIHTFPHCSVQVTDPPFTSTETLEEGPAQSRHWQGRNRRRREVGLYDHHRCLSIHFSILSRYLAENMDNPDLAEFLQFTDTWSQEQMQQDLSNFDFNALKSTIKQGTMYYVGLAYQGHLDRLGSLVPPEKVPFVSDARPQYALGCFEGRINGERIRGYEQCGDSLPRSDAVLK